MDTPPPPQKQGMGVLAWLGIGCGGIILLLALVMALFFVKMGPAFKKFGTDMQKNPTRAAAELMISVAPGKFEMVAEDDDNKRYTLKEKSSGALITVYWDEKQKKPVTVQGGFSAIPADANPPPEPK